MNKRSLSELYRRHISVRVSPPEVDDVLELARVAHAEDAASPLHADLLRLHRELEPASAQLSADVAAALEQSQPMHRRAAASRRVAGAGRRWRVAAIAASLVAVIGVWNLQRNHVAAPQSAAVSASPDRIFAALDDRAIAQTSARDQIFRGDFKSDEIFNSKAHGG